MKKNYLHYSIVILIAILGSCSEGIEKEVITGKTAVTIDVEGEKSGNERTVSFTGGTAYGEGLYDGIATPTVGANASDGYEIDYFYGGPSSEPQKYNHTGSGSSASFKVPLRGEDHHFKCKFKEKKRTLTLVANPTSGGTVSGGGTYKVKTNIPISATAKSGYTFNGWTVTSGDAKIANASSASTTVQLQSSNSTLQANFSRPGKTFYFRAYGPGEIGIKSTKETGTAISLFVPANEANALNDELYAYWERDEATFREWKVNDVNASGYFSDRDVEYLDASFYNSYPDGTVFYAIFEGVKPSNNISINQVYIDIWTLVINISASKPIASNLSIKVKIDGEIDRIVDMGGYLSPDNRPIQGFESPQFLSGGTNSWTIKIPILHGGDDYGINYIDYVVSLVTSADNSYSYYMSGKSQGKVY